MQYKKTISILGCGWYGFSLATTLINKGLIIKGSTTSVDKLPELQAAGIDPYLVNFSAGNELYNPLFFDCDVLWICFPPKVRSGNEGDYLDSIKLIIAAIKRYGVKEVVFISSTGVYSDNNSEVNELSEADASSESGKALVAAEQLLKQERSFTTTIIRFAGLFGPGRDPGRFLAGKKDIPNGNAPVNLIHLTDCIGISCTIWDKAAFGYTFNCCALDHPTRADFYTKAALRAELMAPEFIAEKTNWKIVNSIKVEEILGYKYVINDLMAWVKR